MRKLLHLPVYALAVSTVLTQLILPVRPVRAQAQNCQEGTRPSGARYRMCLPSGTWNGDLVVYAHGYVPADAPLSLPGVGGSLATPLRSMGYAFAATSYRVNGLAVLPAVEDLLDLVEVFRTEYGSPRRVYLVGASEGGLITGLAVERHPEIFSGGLAMCGPTSSFQDQVNYFGDFRVVFDAYFPDLIPADPVRIPTDLAARWPTIYRERVLPALRDPANRSRLIELMKVTGAAYDPDQPSTIESSIRGVLDYNILATRDAIEKLGGQPFDNLERTYSGSTDDEWLNSTVQHIQADPEALQAISEYETSGLLSVPMVALHTTGDEIVPFFHLENYQEKVGAAGRGTLLKCIPVERYGHCSFTNEEVLGAFKQLVRMADQPQPTVTPTYQPAQTPVPQTGSTPTSSTTEHGGSPGTAVSDAEPNLWTRLVQFFRALVK